MLTNQFQNSTINSVLHLLFTRRFNINEIWMRNESKPLWKYFRNQKHCKNQSLGRNKSNYRTLSTVIRTRAYIYEAVVSFTLKFEHLSKPRNTNLKNELLEWSQNVKSSNLLISRFMLIQFWYCIEFQGFDAGTSAILKQHNISAQKMSG